jgi:hypothetical protein
MPGRAVDAARNDVGVDVEMAFAGQRPREPSGETDADMDAAVRARVECLGRDRREVESMRSPNSVAGDEVDGSGDRLVELTDRNAERSAVIGEEPGVELRRHGR